MLFLLMERHNKTVCGSHTAATLFIGLGGPAVTTTSPSGFSDFHEPHWFISSGRVVCSYTNTWTGGTCNKRKRSEGYLKGGRRSKRRFLYHKNDHSPPLGIHVQDHTSLPFKEQYRRWVTVPHLY